MEIWSTGLRAFVKAAACEQRDVAHAVGGRRLGGDVHASGKNKYVGTINAAESGREGPNMDQHSGTRGHARRWWRTDVL
jgi:hypothetical protein